MEWLVLGDGFFGWRSNMYGIQWIYWAPGRLVQEGEISWKESGINRRISGSLVRSDEDLHPDVLALLPRMKEEVNAALNR